MLGHRKNFKKFQMNEICKLDLKKAQDTKSTYLQKSTLFLNNCHQKLEKSNKFKKFTCLFLAVLGLHYCGLFSSHVKLGLLSSYHVQPSHCSGSLVVEHGLQSTRASVAVVRGLNSCSSWALDHSSVVVVHEPSCSSASGILPTQVSNPCPLNWQADSPLLRHQGSPKQILDLQKKIKVHNNKEEFNK